MAKSTKSVKPASPAEVSTSKPTKQCGIVMPIAAFDGYTTSHWESVKKIITEAAKEVNFGADLVSYSDETSIIHSNIINNLYHNEIVVVDVSGRNPNVMFELGLRLAFDKPTIVIKDEDTPYTFDAGVIDHLSYPRGLDYYSILKFKVELSKKIDATYKRSKELDYRSFLKNFADLKITKAKLDEKEVTASEYVLQELKDIRRELRTVKSTPLRQSQESKRSIIYRLLPTWFGDYKKRIGIDKNVRLSYDNLLLFTDWIESQINKPILDELLSMEPDDIIAIANEDMVPF